MSVAADNMRFKWRKAKVLEKSNVIPGHSQASFVETEHSDGKVYYTTLDTIVLTEQQYEEMRLERKFILW